jgi:hypothetical protein
MEGVHLTSASGEVVPLNILPSRPNPFLYQVDKQLSQLTCMGHYR